MSDSICLRKIKFLLSLLTVIACCSYCFSANPELRKLKIGFIVNDLDSQKLERNVRATLDYLKKHFNVVCAMPDRHGRLISSDRRKLDYNNFKVIWYTATERNAVKELLTGADVAAMLKYINQGGGMLLGASAIFLVNEMGIEKAVPRYIAPEYNQHNSPYTFSVAEFRSHPIFKNFEFDFQPYISVNNSGHCAMVDFYRRNLTNPDCRVLNYTRAKEKSLVEFFVGKGKIITVGWGLPDFTMDEDNNIFRAQKLRLYQNIVSYLAGLNIPSEKSAPKAGSELHLSPALNAHVKISVNPVQAINRKLFGVHITDNYWFPYWAIDDPKTKELNTHMIKVLKELGLRSIRWNVHQNTTWFKGKKPEKYTTEQMIERLEQACRFSAALGIPMENCATFAGGSGSDARERMTYGAWLKMLKELNVKRKAGIRYWELLNEPWAHHCSEAEYIAYARPIAKAMKKIDPSIKIGISGNYGLKGDARIVKALGQDADFLIFHFYFGRNGMSSLKDYYQSGYFGIENFKETILALKSSTSAVRNGHAMPIGLTEWGCQAGEATYRNNYMSALLSASFLLQLFYLDTIEFANVHMFSDFIGVKDHGIKPLALVFKLFTRNVGDYRTDAKVKTGTFTAYPDLSGVQANKYEVVKLQRNIPYMAALSTISKDEKTLSLILINRALDRKADVTVELGHSIPSQNAEMQELNNFSTSTPGILGMNYEQGKKGERKGLYRSNIQIRTVTIPVAGKQLKLKLNEHSVSAIQIRLK